MNAPLRIKEAVVVEGRYDKAALSGVIDTLILETAGFGVFKDEERLALLRRLAAKRGLIVLTDSDGAGFVIRSFLKGAIPKDQVKHAYIPDVYGKERRKRAPGREGKLGVEGMPPEVLRDAVLRAGATVLDGNAPARPQGSLTPADLYALGLSGTPDAAVRRAELLRRLSLPEHMSAKALLAALNALYTPEELDEVLRGPGPTNWDLAMDIVIKPMESDSEIRGKAYVHWKAWQDAYSGLVDQAYLDSLTIEKCTDIAFRWPDNLLVAKENDKVIGFVGYGVCGDDPLTGEIFSIYILKEYYDKKIGYALMCAALEKLSDYGKIYVWVLEGNRRAIRFYEKCGFQFDGTRKQIELGTTNTEIRMILDNDR